MQHPNPHFQTLKLARKNHCRVLEIEIIYRSFPLLFEEMEKITIAPWCLDGITPSPYGALLCSCRALLAFN
ncbi:hypothetical protein SADUNF_Sadunf06G0150900 [Salix dunnii]|uniref:Uncharacterized protein n=1 Tax=Salix dunnii TaxID=1413687 RepID=A0A835MXB5_9ROSI|nr:hypothetical protein SADUNF_Sadunf06G0150900 [Salix dunnii]